MWVGPKTGVKRVGPKTGVKRVGPKTGVKRVWSEDRRQVVSGPETGVIGVWWAGFGRGGCYAIF